MTRGNIDIAPLEGYTTSVFRNVYRRHFQEPDRYFTPFIACNRKAAKSSKELRDLRPEENQNISLVPQVISNHAPECIETCKRIRELGYTEVNLNCGCPSGTVTSKGRGAGILRDPDNLDLFLEEFFQGVPMDVSVKTRLGWEEPEEFHYICDIYKKYPIKELIIHPRTRQDFYKNHPNLEAFAEAVEAFEGTNIALCYNGDIGTVQDYIRIRELFPNIDRVMIGRGVIGNPLLVEQIRNWEETGVIPDGFTGEERKRVKAYVDDLLEAFASRMSGDTDVLYKMKAFWMYMSEYFCDGKQKKAIRKMAKLSEYPDFVNRVLG